MSHQAIDMPIKWFLRQDVVWYLVSSASSPCGFTSSCILMYLLYCLLFYVVNSSIMLFIYYGSDYLLFNLFQVSLFPSRTLNLIKCMGWSMCFLCKLCNMENDSCLTTFSLLQVWIWFIVLWIWF